VLNLYIKFNYFLALAISFAYKVKEARVDDRCCTFAARFP